MLQMATPQRKKVEANRRSSFLENIRKEAEREEEKKKEKQQKQKGFNAAAPLLSSVVSVSISLSHQERNLLNLVRGKRVMEAS